MFYLLTFDLVKKSTCMFFYFVWANILVITLLVTEFVSSILQSLYKSTS